MGFLNTLFGFFTRDNNSPPPVSHLVDSQHTDLMISPSRQFPTHESLIVHCLDNFDRELNEFITFTNHHRPDHFVQVVYGENTDFNFHYPFDDDPCERINLSGDIFPDSFELFDWEAGVYAMYNGQRIDGAKVAEIVDTLFVRLFKAPPEFTLTGTID